MSGPSVATIKRLFAASSNNCAYTKYRQPLFENGILVGEMCHINGERPGAARYDPSQTMPSVTLLTASFFCAATACESLASSINRDRGNRLRDGANEG